MSDIPIGILTRNRPVYLNETLRSIAESDCRVRPVVYDDSSDTETARRFLDTDDNFKVRHKWPVFREWKDAGLDRLPDDPELTGIGNTYDVVRIDVGPVGVTEASCQAICDMFDMHPGAHAVMLLQDDVVVDRDWYARMVEWLDDDTAIVAGMHLDYARDTGYVTAQCYMVGRPFFEKREKWFRGGGHGRDNFDIQMCDLARNSDMHVELVRPYACQHIGVVSEVRPWREFRTDDYVRMGVHEVSRGMEWDRIVSARRKVCRQCENLVGRSKCKLLLKYGGCSTCGMWSARTIQCPEGKWKR